MTINFSFAKKAVAVFTLLTSFASGGLGAESETLSPRRKERDLAARLRKANSGATQRRRATHGFYLAGHRNGLTGSIPKPIERKRPHFLFKSEPRIPNQREPDRANQ